MVIYFVSNNEKKLKEVIDILRIQLPGSIDIREFKYKLEEIQSEDSQKIVRDKTLKAFFKVRRPLFVEQTGMYIEDFGNLPGGLTQIVFESITAEKFCEIFGNRSNTNAIAKTIIGYCDGRSIKTFEGSIRGRIASEPRGSSSYQWDSVFIPEGYTETFAELGELKNEISMRRKAVQAFADYLKEKR